MKREDLRHEKKPISGGTRGKAASELKWGVFSPLNDNLRRECLLNTPRNSL